LIREFPGGMICCEWADFLEFRVARNKVQFQKGLREAAFDRFYGTEEAGRAIVYSWRWAERFRLSGVRGQAALRGEASTIVPVHGLRPADLTDGGPH
jgi:hypothetical protein